MRNRYENPLYDQQPNPQVSRRNSAENQRGAQVSRPLAPHSGDGHGDPADLWLNSVGLYMRANPGQDQTAPSPSRTRPAPIHDLGDFYNPAHSGDGRASAPTKPPAATRADTWKLVMLVVLFLVWISTASALLFLYMDRYLFPG